MASEKISKESFPVLLSTSTLYSPLYYDEHKYAGKNKKPGYWPRLGFLFLRTVCSTLSLVQLLPNSNRLELLVGLLFVEWAGSVIFKQYISNLNTTEYLRENMYQGYQVSAS